MQIMKLRNIRLLDSAYLKSVLQDHEIPVLQVYLLRHPAVHILEAYSSDTVYLPQTPENQP